MTTFRLGVDIGGTFTDILAMNQSNGETYVLKVPSTPWPIEAIANGIQELYHRYGIAPHEISYFSHGTTIAVNTLLQRNGARVGVLTTRGFRDVLELRRLRLSHPNDFFVERPKSLVPRRYVKEINERVLSNGQVYQPIEQSDVEQAVEELLAEGIDALAICFLNSYRNPEHELRAKAWVLEQYPHLYVCTSADIWPQQREYERFLASVINAYIGRQMRDYLQAMECETKALGVDCRIFSTKSNGGVMSVQSAAERPVETLLSGPASGVIGSAYLSRLIGDHRCIALDMGGTSVDISIIDGEISYSTENTVGEFPVIMPAVDVSSIGAGGGSIAWLDAEGVLKIGPRSAGATPGPACYGKGGNQATVTDAYVVAGLIAPQSFLGGTMCIYPELSKQAIDHLGERLGLDTLRTADAIIQVTTSCIYAELLPQMARRGVDPRGCSLLAYGGAGPTHAFMLARELPLRRIIVPPTPGALCALGCLVADLRADFVHTVWQDCTDLADIVIQKTFRQLDDEAHHWLEAEQANVTQVSLLRSADMCYVGQSFEINVRLPEQLEELTSNSIVQRFHERYEAIYGYCDPAAPVRMINARVQIVGTTPKPIISHLAHGYGIRAAGTTSRRIFEKGEFHEARVYQRSALQVGDRFQGPAIVEQYDTTTYVPKGFQVTVDPYLNLVGEKLP
jgi:N-methylhydantoinase A